MVQSEEDEGLHKLGLNGGGPDGEDGLARKDGGALGHGPDVAGEAKAAEIVQEGFAEAFLSAEVFQILFVKAEVLDIVDDLLQPGCDGKAAPVWNGAEEHVEIADLVAQAGLEIAVAHGQLVKITEHGVVEMLLHDKDLSFSE